MKKIKYLMTFAMALIAIFMIGNVNAADPTSGQSYSYKFTRYENGQAIAANAHGQGKLLFESSGMKGICIEVGADTNDTGTGNAVLTKVANTDLLAKVSYLWGVKNKYLDDVNSFNFNLLTRANQYTQNPTDTLDSMNRYEWSEEQINKVKSMVEEARNITVPSSFVMYKGNPSDGTQDFGVWKYTPFSANKKYATDTPSGNNHASVKAGDEIKYNISWSNGYGTMTITDILSKGLTYKKGSANIGEPKETKNADGTTTLVWTTTEASGSLVYTAVVTNDPCGLQINQVQNNATMTVDNEPHKLAELKNPLPSKCYAPAPNDGIDHKKVQVGDDIKYQITLTNVKNEAVTVLVTDILSKGLTFNEDISVKDGTLTNQEKPVIDSSAKTTKIEFTVTVAANSTAVVTYSAKVNSEAVQKVNNNATAKYGNDPEIKLNELDNPIEISKKIIPTPDTGSNIAILGIASGIALVGVGGYFIYKKYKKA